MANAKMSNDGAQDRVVATFEITYRQYLDENAETVAELPAIAADRDKLTEMYRIMVLNRQLDSRIISLQRTGQIGTYASGLGHEALMIGVGSAMYEDDVFFPTYRENGVLITRGVTLTELFAYWSGEERGSNFDGPRKDFPICVTIASHGPHAAGVATAMKVRGEARAAVCQMGDGATSKGDFYETLNLAGTWDLPLVMIVNNNQWAISMRRENTTRAETFAQKAIAAGIPSVQADGNDIIAVYDTVREAINRARAGGGPTVIELITYRMSDHTTADDATRYRTDKEVSENWKKDPVTRLRTYLGNQGWWTKEDEEALVADCKARIEASWNAYNQLPPEPAEAMFDYVYEQLPVTLEYQREIAKGDPGVV